MPESNSARDIRGVDARMESIHELPSQLLEDEGTVHLMVSNKRQRSHTSMTHCHLFTDKDLPDGSFFLWSEAILVPSPELCFCIMAKHLERIELIRLGMELCGHYRMANGSTSYGLEKLTCATKLVSFTDSMPNVRAIAVARDAASRVIDDSCSPRETLIALMCTLPAQSGGFQLPKPAMNQSIILTGNAEVLAGQKTIAGDLYWENQALIIEYDSDEFHASKRAHDIERRNGIEAAGIHVITITTAVASDYERLISCLEVVQGHLRKRIKKPTKLVQEARFDLYCKLKRYSAYTC